MSGITILGEGVLSWNHNERVSDRYGSVWLARAPHSNRYVELDNLADVVGKKGRLIAYVKETRESHHIGDIFRGVGPETPGVGEKIVLGEGLVFVEHAVGVETIGLRPDDGRDNDWMDIKKLYRAHDQTVELVFESLN